MKKITITAFLLLTLFVTNAQKSVDTAAKPVPKVENDTHLITINDLTVIDSILKKKINVFYKDDYDQVLRILQGMVQQRMMEWQRANAIKSPAKKP